MSTESVAVPGEKDKVGLGMSTLRFSVAVPDPVLLAAVIV